jgi:hypothetical protein
MIRFVIIILEIPLENVSFIVQTQFKDQLSFLSSLCRERSLVYPEGSVFSHSEFNTVPPQKNLLLPVCTD